MFTFKPIEGDLTPKKKTPKVKTSANSPLKSQQKVPSSSRKRPLEDEMIYGDELFASARQKEKEIAIKFYPFTPNQLRISSDKKFIIEYYYIETDRFFNVYYFPDASINFDAEKNLEYTIAEESCVPCKGFTSLEEVEEKITRLVKDEYLADRKKKLEELREEERLEKIERDRLEEEADLLTEKEAEEELNNELDTGDSNEGSSDSDSETSAKFVEEEKNEEISSKTPEEKVGDSDKSEKKIGTGNFNFKQIG